MLSHASFMGQLFAMIISLLKLGHLGKLLLREHLELDRLVNLGRKLAALLEIGHFFLLFQD